MLRSGVIDLPDELPDDHPLFSERGQKMLAAIEGSDVWAYVKQGLLATREALFASKPISQEDMWRTWGAMEALTTLLHTGPATVLQYSLLAQKVDDSDKEPSYVAKATLFEG